MSQRERTIVICYDISRDKTRAKLAKFLEKRMARVQESVFEARMSVAEAHVLFAKAKLFCSNEDRLRLYVLEAEGLHHSQTHGGAPIATSNSYWLL